jgi:hypothetical protein
MREWQSSARDTLCRARTPSLVLYLGIEEKIPRRSETSPKFSIENETGCARAAILDVMRPIYLFLFLMNLLFISNPPAA